MSRRLPRCPLQSNLPCLTHMLSRSSRTSGRPFREPPGSLLGLPADLPPTSSNLPAASAHLRPTSTQPWPDLHQSSTTLDQPCPHLAHRAKNLWGNVAMKVTAINRPIT